MLSPYRPSPAARENIRRYVASSSNPSIQEGLSLLLHPALKIYQKQAAAAAKRMKVDGLENDWAATRVVKQDDVGDLQPIDQSLPMAPYAETEDVASSGCFLTAKYLYCMIKPVVMPANGTPYHFRINLCSSDVKIVYALVWTNTGNVIQEWDTISGGFLYNVPPIKAKFKKRAIFEARIPRALLPRLSTVRYLQGASWLELKNVFDGSWHSNFLTSIEDRYYNYSLELFARYAEIALLTPDNPLYIAQALTDAFPYRLGDSITKGEVIADGLAMIDQAVLSEQYQFEGQAKLSQLPFTHLLAWADRSLIHGTDNMAWKFRHSLDANGEKISSEVYHFLFLQPETLVQARELLSRYNLLQPALADTTRGIEAWLQSIWKYRSDGNVIEDACEHQGGYWCDVMREYQEEIAQNRIVIATIGFDEIFKWSNMSASYQMRSILDYGLYYGNCGDTTAIGLAFGKALGLPVIHIHYDSLVNGQQTAIHSFPNYYSSSADSYLPFSAGYNGLPPWKLSGLPEDRIYYYLELPIAGAFWDPDIGIFPGAVWGHSTNVCPSTVTTAEWDAVNRQGVSAEQMRACLAASFDYNSQGR